MKRIVTILLVTVLVLSSAATAYAHPAKQTSIYWGESVGWDIDENYHTNGTTLYYKFSSTDPNLTATFRKYVTDGAALWNGTMTIVQSASAVGTISTNNIPGNGIVAMFCEYSANSSGHLTSWKIVMNRAYSMTKVTLAHEFGHAIGLNDLYNSSNFNKIMCGIETYRTATSPTVADKNGAKVITGVHTTHTWAYKYYPSTGSRKHQKYCTVCNGHTYDIETCIYIQGKCPKCLLPIGVTPYHVPQIN